MKNVKLFASLGLAAALVAASAAFANPVQNTSKDTKKAEPCKTECTKDTKGKTCTHDKSKKDAKDCPAPKKAEDKKPAK